MSHLRIIQATVAGLLILSGLVSLRVHEIWPLLAMSLVLTLSLRFRSSTRAAGRLTEVLVIAFAVIFVLNRLGVAIIFVYKSLIAISLFCLVLLEHDGLLRIYLRESLFFDHFRLCSLVAFIGVTVVAVGNLFYRGESFPLVKVPPEIMILVGVGWAVLNTASEEIIYRGLLLSRLEENVGAPGAILLQGIIFGIAHFWTKVPLGIPGALLSFAFAISLGWLVKKTRSLSAAIYMHFWVDLALFFSVLYRQ